MRLFEAWNRVFHTLTFPDKPVIDATVIGRGLRMHTIPLQPGIEPSERDICICMIPPQSPLGFLSIPIYGFKVCYLIRALLRIHVRLHRDRSRSPQRPDFFASCLIDRAFTLGNHCL